MRKDFSKPNFKPLRIFKKNEKKNREIKFHPKRFIISIQVEDKNQSSPYMRMTHHNFSIRF